jgi:hypothetical protein
VTAAVSPVAAFAGLLVLKMNGVGTQQANPRPLTVVRCPPKAASESSGNGTVDSGGVSLSPLIADAVQIVRVAEELGEQVIQRTLAAELRKRGHRFSNAQLARGKVAS